MPGNLYQNNDVLLTIAPLDHLFVWVNIYEADQAKVAVGQEMEVRFPFLDKNVPSKVEYIASEVSKDTRAILLRTSVPNIDGKLKADMLVRATLQDSAGSRTDGDPAPGDGRHERCGVCVCSEGRRIGRVGPSNSNGGRWLSPRSATTTWSCKAV